MRPGFLRRLLLCRTALCQTFSAKGDETHLWGECTLCGKQVGKISRAAVRRYIEAEERDRAARTPSPEAP